MATTTINLGLSLDGLSNVDSTGKATGDVLEWNSVSGNWEAVTPSGGTPAGSNGEIQFNNSGAFGADSGLVWDNTNKRLGVGATPATNARLDVRAQGALSTDIAFRVRNSANTLDAFKVQGNNEVNLRSNLSLGLYAAGSTRKLYMVRDAETFGIDVDWSGAATTAARIVNSGSGANTALIVSSFNGSSNNAIFASNGDVVVSTGKLVVGNHTASAKLDVKAAGALSTDIAFRVRNSADTIDRLSLTGTAFSITTASRAEMSVTANAINFGLDNHNVVFTHASAGQVLQTQRSVGAAFGHLATLGLSNVETLTNGSTIFGSTIRAGVLTNVQNKMHFVCDQTKWGLDGVYSAGFQWFKGDQSGDAAFNTATLPSITTANRQMWLTPENSLLFFNTSGITFTTNTDSFQQYSADITAGNAAPHFRTENGSIIKLYQQSAVTSSQGLADVLTNVGLLSGSSVIAPTFPYTGSAEITGSLTVTGSVAGAVQTLAIISSTASLDLSQGNFFELTLSSSTTTYLEPINIQPGQTINLKINQPATSGSLTYDSTLKFPGGIPYSASATGSVTDIVSLISFDSTTLYATAIKNLS